MKRLLLTALVVIICSGLAIAQHSEETDVTAPMVVSTDPVADGEVVYTLRPVIRIEYDELLDWSDVKNGNCITVTDAQGTEYLGKVVHTVVKGKSVVHFYFNADLPLDKAFLVKVSAGLTDLYGNATDDYFFRFLSEYREMTYHEMVLAMDNTNGWWAPSYSGSTKGLTTDESENSWTSTSELTVSPESASSCHLHYTFSPSSADGLWQIRQYYSVGANTSHSDVNGVLTFWLYGDASNNSVSAMLRANSSNGGLKYQAPQTLIDFRGWKLIVWDLNNDAYTSFSGSDALLSIWRFDSFFLRHLDENGVLSDWSGDLYFDNLDFNRWATGIREAKIDDITIPSAIEDIVKRDNTPVEYYNLQGVKVSNPRKGIFVKRQGTKSTKVVVP